MGKAILAHRGTNKFASELLADVTLNSAQTTIDLTGLNLIKGEVYKLIITCIVNGATNIALYANADTTAGNYNYQRGDGNGTTISATRGTTPMIITFGTTANTLAEVDIVYTEESYFTFISHTSRNYNLSNNQRIENFYGGSTVTHASLTRLQIISSTASRLQSGTRVQLYKEAK